jgi:protein-S-isoprenylcysteine O-methyltransferase Ste14
VRLTASLALRSLLVLVLIPGTVTLYIPSRILERADYDAVRASIADARSAGLQPRVGSALAVCLIALGAGVLLRCVWDFFAVGRGTLAPFDPPRVFVSRGLYRYTRNPMYNGVLAVLLGEAWLFRSTPLLQYAGLMFVIFNVAVLVWEEPSLEAQFGDTYRVYRQAVPRWGFTMHPFEQDQEGKA